MQLIDADGLVQRQAGRGPALHPFAVAPLVPAQAPGHGSRSGAQLGVKGVGVGLHMDVAVLTAHRELVKLPARDARNEPGPDAGHAHGMQGGGPVVPAVPVSQHAHLVRVRSPDGEAEALRAVQLVRVRAEDAVDVPVLAPSEQIEIEGGDGDGGAQDGLRVFSGVESSKWLETTREAD